MGLLGHDREGGFFLICILFSDSAFSVHGTTAFIMHSCNYNNPDDYPIMKRNDITCSKRRTHHIKLGWGGGYDLRTDQSQVDNAVRNDVLGMVMVGDGGFSSPFGLLFCFFCFLMGSTVAGFSAV